MNILSIQSHVAYGHVGNSAAVFAMQRLGVEVWPVHTVQLANHRGYPTARGQVFEPGLVREMVQGLNERGALSRCDGVLSGYLGSAATGEAVLDAVAQVKQANAVYCCDPVIGDVERGLYVAPDIAEFFRIKALPAADIATPNHFELDQLVGRTSSSLAEALVAVEALRRLGPSVVLVTSLMTAQTPRDAIELLACDATGRFRLRTPRLPVVARGAGDLVAALFLLHYLRSSSAANAISRAASSVFGILKRTAQAGATEMLLVEAQQELIEPTTIFKPEPL